MLQPSDTPDAFTIRLAASTYTVEWYSVNTRDTMKAAELTVASLAEISFTRSGGPSGAVPEEVGLTGSDLYGRAHAPWVLDSMELLVELAGKEHWLPIVNDVRTALVKERLPFEVMKGCSGPHTRRGERY